MKPSSASVTIAIVDNKESGFSKVSSNIVYSHSCRLHPEVVLISEVLNHQRCDGHIATSRPPCYPCYAFMNAVDVVSKTRFTVTLWDYRGHVDLHWLFDDSPRKEGVKARLLQVVGGDLAYGLRYAWQTFQWSE
ncbi:hypothetical protein BD309DRAFT_949295 [Dichomitus squalens]|uniref:Uncharacterized protein n=1 Tax=Dichomitus squalens TaxID=114155 RepID=A0A4Q9P6K4_9APHY|nr:hypothetical protein BD309DRAFT_949295 [Dichomitus squalens]TBU62394.1 hypothetical protein BD310DRAFT_919334 [Dichomitus squalens]